MVYAPHDSEQAFVKPPGVDKDWQMTKTFLFRAYWSLQLVLDDPASDQVRAHHLARE